MEHISKQQIVIRLPNWVGDMVMATPSFRNLKLAYPKAKFIGAGRAYSLDVLGANLVFDEFITLDKSSTLKNIMALRKYKGSAGILFTSSFGSAVEFYFSGLYPRIGYANDGRSLFLSKALEKTNCSMDQFYANIVKASGAEIKTNSLELLTDPKSYEHVDRFLKPYNLSKQTPILGLNPGAGFGETKRWFKEYFVKIAKMSLKKWPDLRFFVFSAPNEEHLGNFICEQIGSSAIPIFKANPGLNHLKAYIERISIMLTNDSGLRFYALAKNKPTICLFGPTTLTLTNCFLENLYPLSINMHCSPCKHRICPTKHECMRDLTPELVFPTILKLAKYFETGT